MRALSLQADLDQAADCFGTIREVILSAAPLVETLQRFGLQSNAD